MVELDEATRRALLAREAPPASARAEILDGLRARLGGPGGPDDPDDPGDLGDLGGGQATPLEPGLAAGGQLAWAAKLVGATLGLTAAGLLIVKLGAVVAGPSNSRPEGSQPVVEAPIEAAPVDSPEPLVEPPPPEPTLASPSPIAAAPPRKPGAAVVDEPSESTLAAELALVRAAKRLRADDPEAAFAKLELHAQRFANGSLAPERDALRVELLCALGRRAAARKARAEFLARHDDSPLRARVLASCREVGTDSAGAGD
jgi:hypothetical protein